MLTCLLTSPDTVLGKSFWENVKIFLRDVIKKMSQKKKIVR